MDYFINKAWGWNRGLQASSSFSKEEIVICLWVKKKKVVKLKFYYPVGHSGKSCELLFSGVLHQTSQS